MLNAMDKGISDGIRRYAALMGANEFTLHDVLAQLPIGASPSTVRAALTRLAAKGELHSRPAGKMNLYCDQQAQLKLIASPAIPKQSDVERAFYRMVRRKRDES